MPKSLVIDTNLKAMTESDARKLSSLTSHLSSEEASYIDSKLEDDTSFQHFIALITKLYDSIGDKKSSSSFYTAYYCQEAGRHSQNNEIKQGLLLHSLDEYPLLLQDPRITNEVKYFIQWQIGLIKEMLGTNWKDVEETLLGASNYHHGRAEAMKHVIQYYKKSKQYGIAYIYSSIAKEQYYKKIPKDLEWFGDVSFYQWKILNYHASICSHIGNIKEAENTFKDLWVVSQENPSYFTEEQMQSIFQNQKSYQL